jgi:hypothetical protein
MKRWIWLLALPGIAVAAILLTHRTWDETPVEPTPASAPTLDIHVEVLNGCGEDGIARVLGNRLRSLGFDVITVENAESFNYPETLVIDCVGNLEYARQVANAIGVANTIQQIVPDPFRIEEVTVVIGDDYRRLGFAAEGQETATP